VGLVGTGVGAGVGAGGGAGVSTFVVYPTWEAAPMGAPFVDFLSSVGRRLARTVAAIVGSASTTNTATIVGTTTCRRVRLGGDIDDVFESAVTIQGVVIVPVDRALEGGYYGAGLMSVEVGLTNPDPICGVQGPGGCG
jgi:hypothetical protein